MAGRARHSRVLVAVASEVRSQGLGRRLVAAYIARAPEAGKHLVMLHWSRPGRPGPPDPADRSRTA